VISIYYFKETKKYFLNEKLNIYIENKKGEFDRRYQLIEKYCTDEKTELSLEQIKGFIKNPTDRFTVKTYKIQKKHLHTHAH